MKKPPWIGGVVGVAAGGWTSLAALNSYQAHPTHSLWHSVDSLLAFLGLLLGAVLGGILGAAGGAMLGNVWGGRNVPGPLLPTENPFTENLLADPPPEQT